MQRDGRIDARERQREVEGRHDHDSTTHAQQPREQAADRAGGQQRSEHRQPLNRCFGHWSSRITIVESRWILAALRRRRL